MPRLPLSLLPMLVLLAACAGAEEDGNMAIACQLQKCECAADGLLGIDTTPIVWLADGSASCPEGYRLRKLQISLPRV
jgi:hypothetical protein